MRKENYTFVDYISFLGFILILEIFYLYQYRNIVNIIFGGIKYIIIALLCVFMKTKKGINIESVMGLYGYTSVIHAINYALVASFSLHKVHSSRIIITFIVLCVLIAVLIKVKSVTYKRRRETEKKNWYKFLVLSFVVGIIFLFLVYFADIFLSMNNNDARQILIPLIGMIGFATSTDSLWRAKELRILSNDEKKD